MKYAPHHLKLAQCLRSLLVFQAYPLGAYFSHPVWFWREWLALHGHAIPEVEMLLPQTDKDLEKLFFDVAPLLKKEYGISLTCQKQNHHPYLNIWTAMFEKKEAIKHFDGLSTAFQKGDYSVYTLKALWEALTIKSEHLPTFKPLPEPQFNLLSRLYQASSTGIGLDERTLALIPEFAGLDPKILAAYK
ncbi:hypothetical protein EON80_19130 [bacterium]|nr:MAG: hypothetical protein EON80_19130 [bacterium]